MSPDQQRSITAGCRFCMTGDPLPQQPRLQRDYPTGAAYGPLDAPAFIPAGSLGSSTWGVLQVSAVPRAGGWE